jgi:hypothetical protein
MTTTSLGGAARAWWHSEYRRIERLADEAAEAVTRAGGVNVDSPERREFVRLENTLTRMRDEYAALRSEG